LIIAVFLLFPLAGVLLFVFDVEDNVTVKGVVSPEQKYSIVSHIDGRLTALNVRVGQKVREGDVLAVIDSFEYQNSLTAIEAEIHQLEAELASAEVIFENKKADPLPADLVHAKTNLMEFQKKEEKARDKLQRYTKLEGQQAASRHELETIEQEYITINAELLRAQENYSRIESGLAKRNIKEAEMTVQLVKAKLESRKAVIPIYKEKIEKCKLLAPADGIVLSIPCRDSMYVVTGTPAIELAGGTETIIWAYVEEAFIRKIKVGQEALVRSEVYNHLQYGNFDAEVIKISDMPVNSADGIARYPVKLRMDTDNFNIKYGSNVIVTIVIGNSPAIYALLNISEEDSIIQHRIEQLQKKAQKKKERLLNELKSKKE